MAEIILVIFTMFSSFSHFIDIIKIILVIHSNKIKCWLSIHAHIVLMGSLKEVCIRTRQTHADAVCWELYRCCIDVKHKSSLMGNCSNEVNNVMKWSNNIFRFYFVLIIDEWNFASFNPLLVSSIAHLRLCFTSGGNVASVIMSKFFFFPPSHLLSIKVNLRS